MSRSSQILKLRDCVVDLGTRQVSRSDGTVRLTSREVEVLRYMAERSGQLVTRAELEREVWAFGPLVQSEAVAIAMRRLRRKLEIDTKSPGSLHTEWGEGWILELHVGKTALSNEPFFGREEELGRIAEDLDSEVQLLTLRGPGGSGKTCTARRFAADYERESCFVDLTECLDRDAAILAILKALGVEPWDLDRAEDQLAQVLRGLIEPPLLILDNLEHLTDELAAPILHWLEFAPELQVLVTTRIPLGLPQEHLLDIGPLGPEAAAELFLERAHRRAPGFQLEDAEDGLFADLLERLDYLPLALELTAARLALFSLSEIYERLDVALVTCERRASRHASMQATVACSWEMLSQEERRVLCRASVFRGGFTVAGAEPVLDVSDAPELLNSLLEKSLLRLTRQETRTRLSLYEAVRAFASLRLQDTDAVMKRHCAAMITVGEALRQESLRTGIGTRRLESEEQNLILALQTAKAAADATATARLSLILLELYTARGPRALQARAIESVSIEELDGDLALDVLTQQGVVCLTGPRARRASAILERACVRAEGCRDVDIAGRTWIASAVCNIQAGEYEVARAHLLRIIDDPERPELDAQVGTALGFIGLCDRRQMRLRDADTHLARAISILEAANHQKQLGRACLLLAAVRAQTGHLEAALRLSRKALTAYRKLGHRRLEHYALNNIATYLGHQGRYKEALALFEGALEGNRRIGNMMSESISANNLSELLREMGDLDRAEQLVHRTIELGRALGNERILAIAGGNLGLILSERGEEDTAIPMLVEAIERCRDLFPRGSVYFSYVLSIVMADRDALGEARRWLDHGAKTAEGRKNVQTGNLGVLAEAHVLLARARQAQSPEIARELTEHARQLTLARTFQDALANSIELRLGLRKFEATASRSVD